MSSAQAKGAILSLEALLSLLAAVSLLALLPISSHPQPSEYVRIYEYQVLQDVMEVIAKDKTLANNADEWASGNPIISPIAAAGLQNQLEPIMAGLGFCLRLEAEGTSPEVNSPASCVSSEPRDPVSTFRVIQLRRVNAMLWKD